MSKKHCTRKGRAEEISLAERANEIELAYCPDDPIEIVTQKLHLACSKVVNNPGHAEANGYLQVLLAGYNNTQVREFQKALKNINSITDAQWREARDGLKRFLQLLYQDT